MRTLKDEFARLEVRVRETLPGRFRASLQRYDGEISPVFAEDPHIDLNVEIGLGSDYGKAGVPYCFDGFHPRRARLSAAQVSTINDFVRQVVDGWSLEAYLVRFEAGRLCYRVIAA